MLAAIALGLTAAFFQSISYVLSRAYVQHKDGGLRALLVRSHVIMGAAAAMGILLFPASLHVNWKIVTLPLVTAAGSYLLGQAGSALALKFAEPSRVSPLLGLKIVILAGITSVYGTQLQFWQWAAVALCVVAAVVLNFSGGASHPRAVFGIAVACVGFAWSDWNISLLVGRIDPARPMQSAVTGVLLNYALCGLFAAVLLPWLGSKKPRHWLNATPYAASWLVSMVFLFGCFAVTTPVLVNILQSTRGLMSIVMGAALASMGLLHLEPARSRGVGLRRVAAGTLMLAAVILYVGAPQ